MKKSIHSLLALAITVTTPTALLAGQNITLQNHSFTVITETDNSTNPHSKKVAIFLKNEGCTCQYNAMFDGVSLGEGIITVGTLPHFIQLGNNNLKIDCLPQKDVLITVK